MCAQATQKRQSDVRLIPGLYLIRIIQRRPGGGLFEIHAKKLAADGRGKITFFAGVGVHGQSLRQPGECLVARVADGEANLILEYCMEKADGLDYYAAKIDRVDDSGKLPARNTQGERQETPRSPLAVPLKIIGLIESRGEVVAASGQWLGNVDGNQAIDGLSILWPDKPDNVDLAVTGQVRVVGALPEVTAGNFVGIRDSGLPLTGLALRLVGLRAPEYEIQMDAAFSGWGVLSCKPGQDVKLTGPTATEPLIAIRINLARRAE